MQRDHGIRFAQTALWQPQMQNIYASLNQGNLFAIHLDEDAQGNVQRERAPPHVRLERLPLAIRSHNWIHRSSDSEMFATGVLRDDTYFYFEKSRDVAGQMVNTLKISRNWRLIVEDMPRFVYGDYLATTEAQEINME